MSGPEDNPEEKYLADIRDAEAFRQAVMEGERLIREAIICLVNTTERAHVANVGKAIWRLLDAAGQLAEICPKEIYDPTQPTGMGFGLKIRSGESLKAEKPKGRK